MAGPLNIKLTDIDQVVLNYIKEEARKERWAGTAGLKQFCKERFKARLNTDCFDDITSITFSNQEAYNTFISNPELTLRYLRGKYVKQYQ